MKRWQLFLGILFLTLSFAGSASANNVKIALTATFPNSATEIRPGVIQYKTSKVRITQKDVLEQLQTVYGSFPDGASLYCAIDGTFRILDANGTDSLHTVPSGVLGLAISSGWIRNGITDSNPGGKTKIKNLSDGMFTMNIDASNFFALAGLFDVSYSENAIFTSYLYNLLVLGHGKFDGEVCILSGKVQIKIRSI